MKTRKKKNKGKARKLSASTRRPKKKKGRLEGKLEKDLDSEESMWEGKDQVLFALGADVLLTRARSLEGESQKRQREGYDRGIGLDEEGFDISLKL